MAPSENISQLPTPLTSPTTLHQPSHSRTMSVSSDRPSMAGSSYGSLLSPPASVLPPPNYIASSAGSQIVTNDHDGQSDTWFEQHGIEPSGETALVSPSAMALVNKFLDHLLFNFLATSKSVSLASLRPAIMDVLRPKLANEAIRGAEQELREYFEGGEIEELAAFHNGVEPTGRWDLELAWKRTRLRCMVYSSLGDMEEEDEDHWTEETGLELPANINRFSNTSGVVSPAVAIFLTSVLEFMGEQILIIGGQTAYQRLQARHEREEREGVNLVGEIADRLVVEDLDIERAALDRTLGRLWRGWKKRIRSPSTSMSMGHSFSRESLKSRVQSRRGSLGEPSVPTVEEVEIPRTTSRTESMIHENAARIALPMGAFDVEEIENPWLAVQSDNEDADDESEEGAKETSRPRSLILPRNLVIPSNLEASQSHPPIFLSEVGRKRSHSLPTPFALPSNKKHRATIERNVDSAPAQDSQDETKMEEPIASVEVLEHEKSTKPATNNNEGVIAGVLAGAISVGAAAVAGITAVAKGETPQTAAVDATDSEDEEVEIMTSSRVSLGGPISPDETAIPVLSVRPQSIHSLRMVDIPHSPTRSRQSSVGSIDYMTARPVSLSRNSSFNSPTDQIHAMHPISRTATASPIARSASAHSHQARKASGNVLPEVEEQGVTSYPRTTVPIVASVPERSLLREKRIPGIQGTDKPHNEKSDGRQQISSNSPYFVEPQFAPSASHVDRGNRDRDLYIPPSTNGHQSPAIRSPDSGAPTLTPLREMVEGAPDSDDASSIAPSFGTNEGNSVTSAPVQYRPYEGRKTPEQSRAVSNTSSPQRVRQSPHSSPSQSRRDDENTPRQHGFAKNDRPLHTSSSSTSSGSHKVRAVRTSEDSHHNGSEKSKSFDELIQSDQTIQYTLTPQNMRDIDLPESPRNAALPALPQGHSPEASRPRSHSNKSSKSSKSATKGAGAFSNHFTEDRSTPLPPSKNFKAVPRSTPNIANTGSRVRSNAPQARDARIERDSISDFADFIRSTGPSGGTKVTILSNSSVARTGTASSDPRSSSSSAVRRRLQAREAAVPNTDDTSELIDFIRQGPPSEKTHDNPRIPRTVAPFRTTMDSDQMSGAVGGRVSDLTGVRDSAASSNATNDQSMHSSVHSQSGLIKDTPIKKDIPKPIVTRATPAPAPTPTPIQKTSMFDEEDQMPKRKQRRVRDPYAIDLSDEDEDEFEAPPVRKPQRQEESLIDFLNNVPPPPPSNNNAIFEAVSSKAVAKKSSSPSLMSRFSRHGSTAGDKLKKDPPLSHANSIRAASASRINGNAPQIPPTHIPLDVKQPSSISSTSPSTRYTPSAPTTYSSRLESERNPARPRVQQRQYQSRDDYRPARSAASDLADFLNNTPPPPGNGMNQPNYGGGADADKGGFASRMFGRRKKVAGTA